METGKADKIFKDLGFKKITETKEIALYTKNMLEICFYNKHKVIGINTDTGETVFGVRVYGCTEISFKELQAINEKCKELGWL